MRWPLLCALSLLTSIPSWGQSISSFETDQEVGLFSPGGTEVRRVPERVALRETPASARAKAPPAKGSGALLREVRWVERAAEQTPAGLGTVAKQVTIPLVERGPECDGDLSDEVWARAAKLGAFTMMDGSRPPSQQTRVALCADQSHLYFGVECLEESIAQLTARISQDGGPVWEDDSVELFFDPTLQRSAYRQVIINSLGKVSWYSAQAKDWRPEVLRGVRVEPDKQRWCVEIGVPLASLQLTSSAFGLNVCRERRPLQALELSCWSPTGQSFGVPERFGLASIGGSYLGDYHLGRGCVGRNELQAMLRNESEKPRKLLALLRWSQPKATALYRQTAPRELASGQSERLIIPYEIANDRAPVNLEMTVQDAETGQALTQRSMQQQVLPIVKLRLTPRLQYLGDAGATLQAELNLAPELRRQAVLEARVLDAAGTKVLGRMTLKGAAGDQLHGTVSVGGLGAGKYWLEVIVKAGPERAARRYGAARIQFLRIAGPFD